MKQNIFKIKDESFLVFSQKWHAGSKILDDHSLFLPHLQAHCHSNTDQVGLSTLKYLKCLTVCHNSQIPSWCWFPVMKSAGIVWCTDLLRGQLLVFMQLSTYSLQGVCRIWKSVKFTFSEYPGMEKSGKIEWWTKGLKKFGIFLSQRKKKKTRYPHDFGIFHSSNTIFFGTLVLFNLARKIQDYLTKLWKIGFIHWKLGLHYVWNLWKLGLEKHGIYKILQTACL